MKEIWASLEKGFIFRGGRLQILLRLLLGRGYLYTDKGLRDLITMCKGDIAFEDMSIPLYVTATDLDTGQLAVFHQGPLAPSILASTAVPGLFPLVTINGHTYGDGCLLSNCSIETAMMAGATHVVVIHCPYAQPRLSYGVLRPVFQAFWVSLGRLCQLEVERFQPLCPTLLLRPEVGVGPDRNGDFSRTAELMEDAKEWTAKFLEEQGTEFLEYFMTWSPILWPSIEEEATA